MRPILTVVNAGGHLTQSLCVMKAAHSFVLVTSGKMELDVGAKEVISISSTQFNPLKHFANVFKARKIIKRIDPVAIFSTGGPICLPFALAAKLMNKKFIYLDTLSRVDDVSNTARLLYKYKLASEIYCQWQNIAEKYPGIQYVGKTFDICGENAQQSENV